MKYLNLFSNFLAFDFARDYRDLKAPGSRFEWIPFSNWFCIHTDISQAPSEHDALNSLEPIERDGPLLSITALYL